MHFAESGSLVKVKTLMCYSIHSPTPLCAERRSRLIGVRHKQVLIQRPKIRRRCSSLGWVHTFHFHSWEWVRLDVVLGLLLSNSEMSWKLKICERWSSTTRHRATNLHVPPCPSRAPVRASLALPNPSSRHTTVAARMFQLSSHTVPHSPFFNTSTRPSPIIAPPLRRTKGCYGDSPPKTKNSEIVKKNFEFKWFTYLLYWIILYTIILCNDKTIFGHHCSLFCSLR